MTKREIITELEGYRDIIVNPDKHTIKELAEKLRYYRCCNCISYKDEKG